MKFTLSTKKFITLWVRNLEEHPPTKTKPSYGDWRAFVDSVMNDNGDKGIAKGHKEYFKSTEGALAFAETVSELSKFYESEGEDKSAAKNGKHFFYSEKCLSKCNAIRSKAEMKGVPRPANWKKREGISNKRGGAVKTDWNAHAAKFAASIPTK